MFGKLTLIILSLGALSCVLLVQRQQRIDLAAEMSRTHMRLRQHERALWRLRTDIAFATRPDRVRRAIERLGVEWESIPGRLDQRRWNDGPHYAEVPPAPVPRGDRMEYGG
ncbi:MAG: hypothetical protein KDA22_09070 [Phycisphaerales bacterium]|nr:hypothetical protein [Phycisphaerales bacterium]